MGDIIIPGLPDTYPIPGVRGFPLTGQGVRSPGMDLKTMLIGPKVAMPAAQGIGAVEATFRIPSASKAAEAAGWGSPIHRMARDILSIFPLADLYGCICAPSGTPAQATASLVFSGSPASSGYVRLRIAGRLLSVPVASGDTPATVATAVAAAIGLALTGPAANLTDLPVYASVTTATTSLLAKVKGADGNLIGYTCHIEGATGLLVGGATSASGKLTSGTGEMDWDGALDAILDEDPAVYWLILPATNDTTVLTTGVDALKARVKLSARPDIGKLMRVLLGHTGTEAEGKALSDAWEEGTQDDETGHRGRIVWGTGLTLEPWLAAAGFAGLYLSAVATRINENPVASGGVIPTIIPPASKADGPCRADIVAALNDGLIPLVYDFDRNQTAALRSITAKHSTGCVSDYRARPTVVSDVLDFVCKGLETSLGDIYRGFSITDDGPDGEPPEKLPRKTTTPTLIRRKIFYLLKRDYFEPGYIDNVEALFEALLVQRNTSVTSRADADISVIVRRWLEQIFFLLREVGGEA
jgi:phage tail sheath gpL-like